MIVCTLILLSLCSGLVFAYATKKSRADRLARFKNRQILPLEQLARDFFPSIEPNTVISYLTKISVITGVPAGKLRPTDRFNVELSLQGYGFVAGEWDDLDSRIPGKSHTIQSIADYLTEVKVRALRQ